MKKKSKGEAGETLTLEERRERRRIRREKQRGYRELSNLKLDGSGVWSAQTTVNGKRVMVEIDPQGDIVSQ